jgi:hypothetical protein
VYSDRQARTTPTKSTYQDLIERSDTFALSAPRSFGCATARRLSAPSEKVVLKPIYANVSKTEVKKVKKGDVNSTHRTQIKKRQTILRPRQVSCCSTRLRIFSIATLSRHCLAFVRVRRRVSSYRDMVLVHFSVVVSI